MTIASVADRATLILIDFFLTTKFYTLSNTLGVSLSGRVVAAVGQVCVMIAGHRTVAY